MILNMFQQIRKKRQYFTSIRCMGKKKNNGEPYRKNEKNSKPRPVYDGTVVDPIKGIMFHVQLDGDDVRILGYLSGNMIRNRIRLMDGDRVRVEISNYDTTKGRIIRRLSPSKDSKPESTNKQPPWSKDKSR